jgi:hypothetical protein
MKLRPAAAVTAVLAAVVTGCAGAAGPSGAPFPYTLYTHCGIGEASIGGRWFGAGHPLSDGNGNPPPGWGNPGQPGTIRMLSATTAEFRDSLGHVVRFHLLPGATAPKHVCSLPRPAPARASARNPVPAPAPRLGAQPRPGQAPRAR